MTSTSDPAHGLSIVIPCLDEAATIAEAVREAWRGIAATGLPGEVVVADNGSSDGSPALAVAAGARVVPVAERGYGAALDAGIRSARHALVLFADADLSYPFTEAPRLCAPLLHGDADFALGSRLTGTIDRQAMPLLNRYLGTPVLSLCIRTLFRLPVSDCNSGMRALRRRDYPDLGLCCPGMEYASEMLIAVARRRLRYAEVPIAFRKDRRGRTPHLRRWRDGWRHLRFIIGSVSSPRLIGAPAAAGALLLLTAFGLSLREFFQPEAFIRYHSAFIAIALATPLLLISASALLVRVARDASGHAQLRRLSDTAAPFYASAALFVAAFLQIAWLVARWFQVGFLEMNEMGGVIRLMVFSIAAAVVFGVDLGLGLLGLVPRHQHAQGKTHTE